MLVTTSWDDGRKYDLRLARSLKQYGLKATFYIAPRNRELAEGDAGYRYARTVARHAFTVGEPYKAPTSLHTSNHWPDLWKIVRSEKFQPVKLRQYFEWNSLGRAMFDRVAVTGGVFHLWGHSREIDQHNDWERLEGMFRYISARPCVKYVTNGELA